MKPCLCENGQGRELSDSRAVRRLFLYIMHVIKGTKWRFLTLLDQARTTRKLVIIAPASKVCL